MPKINGRCDSCNAATTLVVNSITVPTGMYRSQEQLNKAILKSITGMESMKCNSCRKELGFPLLSNQVTLCIKEA